MKKYSLHTVNSIPAEPVANAIYFVKTGDKFIIAVTDISGNVVHSNYLTTADLVGLATEQWVANQNFLTELPTHDHDTRYYTQDQIVILLSQKANEDVEIIAGTGLEGGGNLSGDVTIILPQSTIDDIAKGVTAHGWGNHADAGYEINDGTLIRNITHFNEDGIASDCTPRRGDYTIINHHTGDDLHYLKLDAASIHADVLVHGRMIRIVARSRGFYPTVDIHDIGNQPFNEANQKPINEPMLIQYDAANDEWWKVS